MLLTDKQPNRVAEFAFLRFTQPCSPVTAKDSPCFLRRDLADRQINVEHGADHH